VSAKKSGKEKEGRKKQETPRTPKRGKRGRTFFKVEERFGGEDEGEARQTHLHDLVKGLLGHASW